ncbi:MAG: hypothetical protein mread185_000631 [Mycoplasmataceae bacterium]|nr:MAG: hypothetical protein mread185_000631 [Mycoplasmataceae bacterium]
MFPKKKDKTNSTFDFSLSDSKIVRFCLSIIIVFILGGVTVYLLIRKRKNKK